MKFSKKPVVVEAEQFFPDRVPWPEGVYASGGPHTIPSWSIVTLEGVAAVVPGAWIITGVKGERYPCAPDIFAATYELADARTDLALVSDALGRLLAIYEDEIDLGDPPVSRPEWLETAVQIIRREASRA